MLPWQKACSKERKMLACSPTIYLLFMNLSLHLPFYLIPHRRHGQFVVDIMVMTVGNVIWFLSYLFLTSFPYCFAFRLLFCDQGQCPADKKSSNFLKAIILAIPQMSLTSSCWYNHFCGWQIVFWLKRAWTKNQEKKNPTMYLMEAWGVKPTLSFCSSLKHP